MGGRKVRKEEMEKGVRGKEKGAENKPTLFFFFSMGYKIYYIKQISSGDLMYSSVTLVNNSILDTLLVKKIDLKCLPPTHIQEKQQP